MNENAANSFIRVWKVMEMCYQILVQENRGTQRELFYKLLCDSPEYFTSQSQVNRTIQDLVALLRCSRFSLGIMASSRGAVASRLWLQRDDVAGDKDPRGSGKDKVAQIQVYSRRKKEVLG
ncbi:hypothetical protein BUALT_Bualt02G0159600 [Buddleja alternifolia]|uniref:Spo11/DNA topoisomerase VI subunit A N-terminal domain-containing protein n=1 Tax=Buddleja alternifolia TaxID=168488 RepID=A0AAV6Y2P9_9LAMI|nr:hypothetical protein BUALT_Bualt02G0159600 [Buddleja alternifolia]